MADAGGDLEALQQQLADLQLAAPYTRLKEKLTNTFGKSKYQLCDELFDMTPLSAEKPSILMSKM